jgi:hypothetical protein
MPAEKAEIQKTSITSSSEDEAETDDDSMGSDGVSSVASILTWAPDENDTTIFHGNEGCSDQVKPNRPTIRVPPSRVRPRTDGHYTDEEIGRLMLEAWRARLRKMHDYLPDRL